jgi:hypothetical protein
MITAAREAGDLATGGERADLVEADDKVSTLSDYGISRDLAADATAMSRLPDDVWVRLHESGTEPTRAAVVRTCRDYAQAVAQRKRDAETRSAEAERVRREINEARRRLTDLQKDQPLEDVPPLSADETSVMGSDVLLDAVTEPAEAASRIDRTPEAKGQEQLISAMSALAHRIAEHDPLVTSDQFRDINVMAARDSVRRLVTAGTVWLRTLNAIYGGN